MIKFSDGPWKITYSELNGYRVSDQSGWGVVVVLKDVNDKENANLIVQAPVMYEALKMIISEIEAPDDMLKAGHVCSLTRKQMNGVLLARAALSATERGE